MSSRMPASAASRRTTPAQGAWARCALRLSMWLLLAMYVVGLALHGEGFEPFVDGWLGILTQVVPAAVCWSGLSTGRGRRAPVACLAVGMACFAVGNALYVIGAARGTPFAFPFTGDLGFLAFYPAALAAVVVAVRREHRAVRGTVWVDALIGGLGAAAVLAVVLQAVFEQAAASPLSAGIALAYPASDLVLVALIVGVATLHGLRVQRHWLPLLAGLALIALADVVFALRVSVDDYVVGTPLDALWALGLAQLSGWAPARTPLGDGVHEEQQVALAVPAVAVAASLGVLVAATRSHISVLAVVLAVLTLVATAVRTHLAFRQLRRLADLSRQATTDDLTGLPNRRAFSARVEEQLARPGSTAALLLLDLNKFKEVNDGLGHHAGDQLLIQVGRRLAGELRGSDLFARFGGDEFAVLLLDSTQDQAVAVAIKLCSALRAPITLEGLTLRPEASIGIALYPEHGHELTVLLRRADIAMYQSKTSGDGPHLFAGDDDVRGERRRQTVAELRTALSQGQLILHFQPKLDLGTGAVGGVEALVRWDHPTRGLLYPDSFLALVEEAGLMHALTAQVLEQALDQARDWRSRDLSLTVAVNLSPSSLLDSDLPTQIDRLLTDRQLSPDCLQLEITEKVLLADRDGARDMLHCLRSTGIGISIDDFGTGYSSLAYLRELPVDELKLDRSFIFPMADDARAAGLVVSIIALAHSLGLRVVAEGVENAVALAELTRHGCDQAQGYYLSRPVPASELEHWLAQRPSTVDPTTAAAWPLR